MKKKMLGTILIFLFLMPVVNAQQAVLKGIIREINEDMFGYNSNTVFRGPLWTDPDFRFSAGRLYIGNIRYPGGTASNYWDWRAGNVMKTITKGWPKWVNDDWIYTPKLFCEGIPEHASVIYCVNMARPTPITGIDPYSSIDVLKSQTTLDKKIEDIIAGIDAFYSAGCELKRVELGNEFYHGAIGGVDEQGSIYTGMPELYVNHANQVARAIHNKYPKIELAVIGESSRSDAEPVTQWTQTIYDSIQTGALQHIDAITFHWYSGPGTEKLNNATDAMKSLSQTFNVVNKKKNRDYDNVPEDLDIWVTEYNTWSNVKEPDNGGPIQGTWTNGMFGANLSLLYTIMGPKIKLLNLHVIGQGAHSQWEMLNNASTLSGNGIACGAIGRAMTGMNKMQVLEFKDVTQPTFANGWPSLIGAKFWNNEKQRSTVLIINSTDKAKNNIDISALFDEIAPKRLMQFFDNTPWDSGISEDEGVNLNVESQLGNKINVPPFSISVIFQEHANLLKNSGFEETSLSHWKGNGVIDDGYKNAYSGTSSLLIDQKLAGDNIVSQNVTVTEGVIYSLKVWIRSLLNSGNAHVELKFFDSSYEDKGSLIRGRSFFENSAYAEDELTFSAPDGASMMEVRLVLENGIGKVWFDEIMLNGSYLTSAKNILDDKNYLSVYPNPVNDHLNIKLRNDGYGSIQEVKIYSIRGQLMQERTTGNNFYINVKGWSKGVYFLSVHLTEYPYPLVSKLVVN